MKETGNWPARIDALCKHYGSSVRLSVAAGIGVTALSLWRNGHRTPSSECARKTLERLERKMRREQAQAHAEES